MHNLDEVHLLDKFTRLLAYLGDEEAADGYQNNNNFVQRQDLLTKEQIFELLPTIKLAIMGDAAALNNIEEDDIYAKVEDIINLSNQFPDQKDELIEYITDLRIQLESELPQNRNQNNEMYGGAKKSSKKHRSTRRKSKTRRANRKNMRKSRSRVARR